MKQTSKGITFETEEEVIAFGNILALAETKLENMSKVVDKDWLLTTQVGPDIEAIYKILPALKAQWGIHEREALVKKVAKKWPTTIKKAVKRVYKPLSPEFKLDFISESKEKSLAQFHSTMGRQIRNMFGLWQNNEKLKDNAYFYHGVKHPDDISHVIMSKVYDKCQQYDLYRRRHGSPICKTEGCFHGPPDRGVLTCEYCGKKSNIYSTKPTTVKPEGTFFPLLPRA